MVRLTYADFEKCAVRTMQLANQSAWRLNHDYVGAEHILMGLCRNQPSPATAILARFGVSVETILGELTSRVQRGAKPVAPGKRPPRDSATRVTEHAAQIASNLGAAAVGNEHLLLGILSVPGTSAWDVLNAAGMQYNAVIAHIQGT